MNRKLFCEINPITYQISVQKGIFSRRLKWALHYSKYVKSYGDISLPILVYSHKSMIRRKLSNVDMELQENKATNLTLAAPRINGILIEPGETFSFWRLVDKCTKSKGYKPGLVIRSGKVSRGVGGGMCQFTNLIHWMVLHSPLTIIEKHHHNQLDLFPDYGRKVPFGIGTSVMFNYLDYQFVNHTDQTFQICVHVEGDYLCGELRSERELDLSYHIHEENSYFSKKEDGFYRCNEVYRTIIDKSNGRHLDYALIAKNHSKVLYDSSYIPEDLIRYEE